MLIQQAEQAQAAGQREEAQRLLLRAEAQAPDHPLVLNARAIDLLQNGDAARAASCSSAPPRPMRAIRRCG